MNFVDKHIWTRLWLVTACLGEEVYSQLFFKVLQYVWIATEQKERIFFFERKLSTFSLCVGE
jgi:hypothetical protein